MLFGGMRESATASEIELPVRFLFSACCSAKPCADTWLPCRVCQDVSHDVFMKMLEFLYTDRVGDISAELAIPLLIASERYDCGATLGGRGCGLTVLMSALGTCWIASRDCARTPSARALRAPTWCRSSWLPTATVHPT